MRSSFLLIPLLAISLSSCVIPIIDTHHDDEDDWAVRAEDNRRSINSLSLNASVESVIALMGQPDITEAMIRDDTHYRILYYRTQRVYSDYRTSKDETTPLLFVDNKLVGWGESALKNAQL